MAFQSIHNELRKDFLSIYKIYSENIIDENIAPLRRACIKELFAFIEADLYLINQFNPYNGFKDDAQLKDKFKETFKHHAVTFGKAEIWNRFRDAYFETFVKLKKVRDNTTHPKSKNLMIINVDTSNDILNFYNIYDKFMIDITTNVFISS